jgi:hypothetical protein
MSYTAAERETVIRCDDVDKIWDVYTAQQTMMTKIKRSGVEPYWTETEKNEKGEDRVIAARYKLTWRQISILKPTYKNKGRTFDLPEISGENQKSDDAEGDNEDGLE